MLWALVSSALCTYEGRRKITWGIPRDIPWGIPGSPGGSPGESPGGPLKVSPGTPDGGEAGGFGSGGLVGWGPPSSGPRLGPAWGEGCFGGGSLCGSPYFPVPPLGGGVRLAAWGEFPRGTPFFPWGVPFDPGGKRVFLGDPFRGSPNLLGGGTHPLLPPGGSPRLLSGMPSGVLDRVLRGEPPFCRPRALRVPVCGGHGALAGWPPCEGRGERRRGRANNKNKKRNNKKKRKMVSGSEGREEA